MDCIFARHVSYGVKGEREACLRAKMSQSAAVVGGVDLAASGMVFLDVGVFRVGLGVAVLGTCLGQVVSSHVQNVTFFATFFSSSMVTVLMRFAGALFGTLNSRIPSLSEAAEVSMGWFHP